MLGRLMISRRFAPLFWCQFLSAFNDNFVRQMLVMLILFRFGGADAGSKVTLAVGIFILPSMLLSALGGELADSNDKALVAKRLKFAEIFVQMIRSDRRSRWRSAYSSSPRCCFPRLEANWPIPTIRRWSRSD